MKYQAILFDMDGTLLDTLTDMQAAVNHILEKYGCPTRTLEEMRRFVGNGAGPLIHRALPQGVDPDREAEILADYRAYYQAHNCVETRPYDGIGPLLERLRQEGVRTAVVSNKPDQTTRTLAARFFPELDGAMGQREGIAPKPAPDMVRAALARLHAAPEETLYVGDSEVDVDTARNAGLDMIGVAWRTAAPDPLRRPKPGRGDGRWRDGWIGRTSPEAPPRFFRSSTADRRSSACTIRFGDSCRSRRHGPAWFSIGKAPRRRFPRCFD